MFPELTMKVMVHESETYTKVGNDDGAAVRFDFSTSETTKRIKTTEETG